MPQQMLAEILSLIARRQATPAPACSALGQPRRVIRERGMEASKSGAPQRRSASAGSLGRLCLRRGRFAVAEAGEEGDAGRKTAGIRRMSANRP